MGHKAKINAKERANLAKRFGWRCWYCGVRIAEGQGHIDHIIPASNGGPDIESNRALTCNFCNMAKSYHSLDEFMSWLEWLRSGKSFTPYNMDLEAVKQAIRDELGDPQWQSKT
jgi:hypothetical protein